ncbi:MAG: hypothetical protein FWF03_01805, partial [Defluviitaleaceae bacterium]|nr:hypothetical protein [Defluviitaleaceae bacterium]
AHGVSAVLNKESEAVAVFCHRRVREYPVAGGPSCCAESVWEPGLIEQALALFKKIGLEGFAMAEFKGPVEKPYILEINPRVWGTYPLARASGAYFSVKYAEAAAGNGARAAESSNGCPYKNGVRMQFFANDLMHLLERRRLGVKTEGSVLLDFISPRVAGGVFEISDLPGSLAYLRMLTKKGSAN